MNPIDRDLAQALDAYTVPPLPADFAARVTARALATQPLAPALPPRRSGRARWTVQRRIGLGLVAGALMSATAAAGVFGDLGVTIPALQRIVAQVTQPGPPAPMPAPKRAAAPAPAVVDVAPPAAVPPLAGPTPEQLEARFRTQDERRAERRAAATQRIESAAQRRIERREAAGLPVPTPEQRATVRGRIEQRVAERDAVVGERREAVRQQMLDNARERQLAPVPEAAVAPAPTPRAAPPAAPPADAATPTEEPAADGRQAAERRPALTSAQREALRQRRQERLERLRRLRQQ